MTMKDWDSAYPEAASQHQINEVFGVHEPFSNAIKYRAGDPPRAGKLLEIGVGTGAFIAAFAGRGYRVTGIDDNAHIVDQANWLLAEKGLDELAEVVLADAAGLPFEGRQFVVAYSQGLMEHFEPEQVAEMLREQMRVAHWVLFSVPTPLWVNPILVDPEYRRTEQEWVTFLAGLGIKVHFSFSYWNQMHAVIVLTYADQAVGDDGGGGLFEGAIIEWPAEELPFVDEEPEQEPVVIAIEDDATEEQHPVKPNKRKRTRRSGG